MKIKRYSKRYYDHSHDYNFIIASAFSGYIYNEIRCLNLCKETKKHKVKLNNSSYDRIIYTYCLECGYVENKEIENKLYEKGPDYSGYF